MPHRNKEKKARIRKKWEHVVSKLLEWHGEEEDRKNNHQILGAANTLTSHQLQRILQPLELKDEALVQKVNFIYSTGQLSYEELLAAKRGFVYGASQNRLDYEHGIPFTDSILLKSLKMADRAIAPKKLSQWMKKFSYACTTPFVEFLTLVTMSVSRENVAMPTTPRRVDKKTERGYFVLTDDFLETKEKRLCVKLDKQHEEEKRLEQRIVGDAEELDRKGNTKTKLTDEDTNVQKELETFEGIRDGVRNSRIMRMLALRPHSAQRSVALAAQAETEKRAAAHPYSTTLPQPVAVPSSALEAASSVPKPKSHVRPQSAILSSILAGQAAMAKAARQPGAPSPHAGNGRRPSTAANARDVEAGNRAGSGHERPHTAPLGPRSAHTSNAPSRTPTRPSTAGHTHGTSSSHDRSRPSTAGTTRRSPVGHRRPSTAGAARPFSQTSGRGLDSRPATAGPLQGAPVAGSRPRSAAPGHARAQSAQSYGQKQPSFGSRGRPATAGPEHGLEGFGYAGEDENIEHGYDYDCDDAEWHHDPAFHPDHNQLDSELAALANAAQGAPSLRFASAGETPEATVHYHGFGFARDPTSSPLRRPQTAGFVNVIERMGTGDLRREPHLHGRPSTAEPRLQSGHDVDDGGVAFQVAADSFEESAVGGVPMGKPQPREEAPVPKFLRKRNVMSPKERLLQRDRNAGRVEMDQEKRNLRSKQHVKLANGCAGSNNTMRAYRGVERKLDKNHIIPGKPRKKDVVAPERSVTMSLLPRQSKPRQKSPHKHSSQPTALTYRSNDTVDDAFERRALVTFGHGPPDPDMEALRLAKEEFELERAREKSMAAQRKAGDEGAESDGNENMHVGPEETKSSMGGGAVPLGVASESSDGEWDDVRTSPQEAGHRISPPKLSDTLEASASEGEVSPAAIDPSQPDFNILSGLHDSQVAAINKDLIQGSRGSSPVRPRKYVGAANARHGMLYKVPPSVAKTSPTPFDCPFQLEVPSHQLSPYSITAFQYQRTHDRIPRPGSAFSYGRIASPTRARVCATEQRIRDCQRMMAGRPHLGRRQFIQSNSVPHLYSPPMRRERHQVKEPKSPSEALAKTKTPEVVAPSSASSNSDSDSDSDYTTTVTPTTVTNPEEELFNRYGGFAQVSNIEKENWSKFDMSRLPSRPSSALTYHAKRQLKEEKARMDRGKDDAGAGGGRTTPSSTGLFGSMEQIKKSLSRQSIEKKVYDPNAAAAKLGEQAPEWWIPRQHLQSTWRMREDTVHPLEEFFMDRINTRYHAHSEDPLRGRSTALTPADYASITQNTESTPTGEKAARDAEDISGETIKKKNPRVALADGLGRKELGAPPGMLTVPPANPWKKMPESLIN
eukprot:Rmarinus@m.28113